MQITNSSSYWQRITPQQTQKAEESQDFTSRLSVESPKTSIIQKQTQEFPQGLSDKIKDLSQMMLTESDRQSVVWYQYADDRDTTGYLDYNVSFVVGDYEYVISQADKESQFSWDDWYSGMPNWVRVGGGAGPIPKTTNDFGGSSLILDDGTRLRPFAPTASLNAGFDFDPYHYNQTSSSAFPDELSVQEDKNYTYSDVKESLKKIENLLDKYLVNAYQQDPDSTETNQLLFLKAQIQNIPKLFEKSKEIAVQYIRGEINNLAPYDSELVLDMTNATIKGFENFAQNHAGLLAEFSMNLAALLPDEQKQELMDALNVVLNYTDHKAYEFLGTNKELLEAGTQLKNALGEYSQNLVTRFSAIDNTDILLNLSGDSKLQTSNNNSRHNESLIDTIRSKLKTTDDSILQKVMSKITNAPKSAEASA